MGIPIISDILDVVKFSGSAIWHMARADWKIVQGDWEGAIGEYAEILKEGWEQRDSIETIIKVQAAMAVAMAYGQVVNAISLGTIVIPGLARATELATRTLAIYTGIQQGLKDKFGPLFRALDTEEVAILREAAGRAHRVGMIISRDYRTQYMEFMNVTRDISREVFGDVNTLNQALVLVQLATADAVRLSGGDEEAAQLRFLTDAVAITDVTATFARTYSRDPGRFWYDINRIYVRPNLREASYYQNRNSTQMTDMRNGLTALDTLVGEADDRFLEYREALNPFLDTEKLLELDRIRRNFQTEVQGPLGELTEFWETEFPAVKDNVGELVVEVEEIAEELAKVSEITEDANELDALGRYRQRQRVLTWMDNLSPLGDTTTEILQEVHAEVESLYTRLEGGR